MSDPVPRLVAQFTPEAYRIRLEADPADDRFVASVTIDGRVPVATDRLLLHARDLEVRDASLVALGGEVPLSATTDAELELVVLRLDRAVRGDVTVRITVVGTCGEGFVGLYRCTLGDREGGGAPMLCTQLFATEARRVFPCVDEPEAKATFQLTATVPSGLLVASNTEVDEERDLGDGRTEVRFAPTIRMSTYLLALVVAPLARTEPVDAGGVALRVVCAPGRQHLAGLALRVGAFALEFFASYFALDYPGTKLDLVAIPDFAYGAMENLGCVTFREAALLVDEATATPDELLGVATVVAHEIAHMWFGDLVTMAWWDGLWLNEAFASFMADVCVDAFRPDWHVWLGGHDFLEVALEVDGLHSTRPIECEVRTPAEALAMVDAITYLKGGAVLRMFEQYLGADVFRDGVRRYLAAHLYANTTTTDLWAALGSASGEPVESMMDTWVLQGGHPVVWLVDGTLRQTPFAFGPPSGGGQVPGPWLVPVRARSLDDGAERRLVLDGAERLGLAEPVVVNTGVGVYRAAYDADARASLLSHFDALGELERAALLADTWALARADLADLGDVVAIATALGDAVEPAAWQVVRRIVGLLARVVAPADRSRLTGFVDRIAAPLHARLGWDAVAGEDARTALLRPLSLQLAGIFGGDAAVRSEALDRFVAGRDAGPVGAAVVGIVAACARPEDHDRLLERLAGAPDPQARVRYRDGLGDFADESAALDTFARRTELFRSQDVPLFLQHLLANRSAGKAVFMALEDDWARVMGSIPEVLQARALDGVPGFADDPGFAAHVEAVLLEHPLRVGATRVGQLLEQLRHNVAFAARVGPQLAAKLA